ncbi:Alcohol O-acetyltransferase [Globomyces sp. JEL0801]|nr:Alcohol O-acetyltransferase [Globomyces sp. JEL0801]
MFDQSKDWTTISYTENSHHPSPSRLTPIKDVSKDESKLTEHEKRKKFLERNRIAASKCRERKKLWMKDMEVQVIELNKTNKELMFNNHQLQGLVADLAARLGKYEEVVFNLPPSQRILKKK